MIYTLWRCGHALLPGLKSGVSALLTEMKKLEGKGVRVPEGKTSERGNMLRSALEGNMIKSRSQTDNAIDEMILILLGDLSAKSNMRS